MQRVMPAALLALALLSPKQGLAGETVIHRCTAADGAVSLQSMPCPPGSTSQVRRLSADYAPPPVPAYVSPAPAAPAQPVPATEPVVSTAAATAATPAAIRPLPQLHQCQPRHGPAYYTDDLARSVRCLPLRITGLDGRAETGAGEACEVQRDTCQLVAEADTCQAWNDYLAQSRERFASAPSRSSAISDTDSAQIALLLAGSACAGTRTQKP